MDSDLLSAGIQRSRRRQVALQHRTISKKASLTSRKKTTEGQNNPISSSGSDATRSKSSRHGHGSTDASDFHQEKCPPEAGKLNNVMEGAYDVPNPGLETNVADEPSSPKRRGRGRPKKDVNKKKRGRPPNPQTQMPPEAEAAEEPNEAEPDEGKRKRGRPKKTSKANLGEETCVPLQTHIMLRRSTGPVDVHAQDLAKALEESNKIAQQLAEELADMREQVETLNESLRREKQNFQELSSKHNQLISLCQEKESALQAAMIDKQNMEARLSQLSKGELESNTRKELVEATNQVPVKRSRELVDIDKKAKKVAKSESKS